MKNAIFTILALLALTMTLWAWEEGDPAGIGMDNTLLILISIPLMGLVLTYCLWRLVRKG